MYWCRSVDFPSIGRETAGPHAPALSEIRNKSNGFVTASSIPSFLMQSPCVFTCKDHLQKNHPGEWKLTGCFIFFSFQKHMWESQSAYSYLPLSSFWLRVALRENKAVPESNNMAQAPWVSPHLSSGRVRRTIWWDVTRRLHSCLPNQTGVPGLGVFRGGAIGWWPGPRPSQHVSDKVNQQFQVRCRVNKRQC